MQFELIAPPTVTAQLMCQAIERRREEVERLELRAATQATCERIDKILGRGGGSRCGHCRAPIECTATSCSACGVDYLADARRSTLTNADLRQAVQRALRGRQRDRMIADGQWVDVEYRAATTTRVR